MSSAKFGKNNWTVVLLFGIIGQIAWAVENMFFNLFVFDEVGPNLDAITLMVQLSGVVATIVTLIAGTLSDKVGNRKMFMCWGYVIWGITVALFGVLTPTNLGSIFSLDAQNAIAFAIVAVIVTDCIMTAFGSTANDACFNAWVTDNTEEQIRGRVESVISILPLFAMLLVAGGFGMIQEAIGYTALFIILGVIISACGVAGFFIIKDSPTLEKNGKFADIVYGFKPSVIKEHSSLYITLLITCVYSIACQIFMPFIIIYMKTYLNFSVIEYSLSFGVAIVAGSALNVVVGKLTDKIDKNKAMFIGCALLAIGLLLMYFMHGFGHVATLITFSVAGFIMICGNVFTLTLTNAKIRDYTPDNAVGKLQGVRMIFTVLIPMFLGPLIGNTINKIANVPLLDAGADAMTTAYIPAPEIYLFASIVALLMIPLIFWLINNEKNTKKGGEYGTLDQL